MAQPLIATVAKAKYIDEMMDNGQKTALALYLLIDAPSPVPLFTLIAYGSAARDNPSL
jgi:hypothetical protein